MCIHSIHSIMVLCLRQSSVAALRKPGRGVYINASAGLK